MSQEAVERLLDRLLVFVGKLSSHWKRPVWR